MALVNGTNYDHIDLQAAAGGDVTRHKLQDTEGRAMLAPTEASSTASAAHLTGSYFILNGVLYQATADIASGGGIVTSGAGQNCEAVTGGLGGDVSELKRVLAPMAVGGMPGQVMTKNSLADGDEGWRTLFIDSNLSQWLYAQDKYINNSYELAELSGYNTYKIPVDPLDFVIVSWTGDDPLGTLNAQYRYTMEYSDGMRRDLGNESFRKNGKNEIFIIPNNAVALYLAFKETNTGNGFSIVKNSPRTYSPDLNYFDHFAMPVNHYTFAAVPLYFDRSNNYVLKDWQSSSYSVWWIKVKAGDTVAFTSLDSTIGLCGLYRDASGNGGVITELSHTFASDAVLNVIEKADTPNTVTIIPNAVKLRIDSGNVMGLETEIDEKLNPLDAQVDGLDARMDSIENTLYGTDVTYTSGDTSGYYKYNSSTDSISPASSSSFTCKKIPVADWMKSVAFTIKSVAGISGATTVFCAFTDASDEFISRAAVAVGTYNLLIPDNAGYIYLGFFGSTYVDEYTIEADSVVMMSDAEKWNIINLDTQVSSLDTQVSSLDTQVSSLDTQVSGLSAQVDSIETSLNGYDQKTAVAFGTSLTYRAQTTGGYLQYLPGLSGMTFDNQGIGSATILGDGGNLDILARIKAYSGYSEKNVCLLEGFVNDWYQNKTLGTWKDTAETTVCGCVRSALNYILSQNANLTVFLILDPYGRNYNNVNCSSSAVNGSGLTQFEYYEEIAKVAESLGIPVIKEYAESQISENTPQYFLDNIHPNAIGAQQSANYIWSKMKNYKPNAVA